MSARMTVRQAMLLLVASNLLWAGTYVAGKAALGSISPVELNCLRFGIAGFTFLPFLWRQLRHVELGRAAIVRLAVLCLFGFVLNKAAEFGGLSLTTASDTALLIASEGLFTAIFGWLLLRETVRGGTVMGLLVALVGVYLVVQRGVMWPRFGGTRVVGDLLIVAALVFEALYSVLGKAELQRYPPLVITAGCVIGSLVVWLPAAAVNVALEGMPRLSVTAWAGVLYLAVAGTTLAYLAWFAGLRSIAATVAAPTLFLQPVVGTVLAVILLGERLVWPTIVGGALIVLGIWIVSRRGRQASEMVGAAEVLA